MDKQTLLSLLQQHMNDSLSEADRSVLAGFSQQENASIQMMEAMEELLQQSEVRDEFDPSTYIPILHSILQSDKSRKDLNMPGRSLDFKRWAVAAALLAMVSVGIWLYLRPDQHPGKPELSQTDPIIQPGREGAILELADGSKLLLDTLSNGIVFSEGSIDLKLKNGELSYQSIPNTGSLPSTPAWNILTIPRGRQFRLTLPDGTRVWLNAASSIRYPVRFTGKERKVEITGEAFLEVARHHQQPFIATANKTSILVLGTSFNVNAYTNEYAMKTTLVEGSVKVTNGAVSTLLDPLQQVTVSSEANGQAVLTKSKLSNANMEQTIAWKNGIFNFNNADFGTVMRQLERWYDIEVRYEGSIPSKEFYGEMGRDISLQEVLEYFSRLQIKYELKGRILIIKKQ